MIIEFSQGKIIATVHEVVVRFSALPAVNLSAHTDALTLMARGANVVIANGAECKWSIKLDDEAQLLALADHLGIAITK
ncbi:DUF3389 domain-containing protein [Vibrio sp. SM6]|uniref:DUF3389 domain-containing protein n=1 Tax=Vibrio agarilyticus TaxID=2726741 RepID=A0A7X8TQV8_9VIBR|nr:DUF3389 family protein [Vibrio agarilyticus]NLS13317.1 DUF3389 domain-containing protein [Vibrio agarilyticus]